MSAALSIDTWHDQAAKLSFRNQAFIDGSLSPPPPARPSTARTRRRESAHQGRLMRQEDVDRAVKAARKAFERAVGRRPPRAAQEDMQKFADLMENHKDRAGAAGDARHRQADPDARRSIFRLDRLHPVVCRSHRQDVRRARAAGPGGHLPDHPRAARHRRRGRALELPVDDGVLEDRPVLAAGNCVILKPAEQSPLTAIRLAELAMEAGVPEGVLQGAARLR